MDRVAVQSERRCAVGSTTRDVHPEGVGARPEPTAVAASTLSAVIDCQHHPITDSDVVDALSHRRDGSGSLVAEHDRELCRKLSVARTEIRVADTAAGQLDPKLARGRSSDLHLLDSQRRADGGSDRCTHRA